MESYKLDRIYTWLSSALGYDKDVAKKYFYDKSEKLFFNLDFENGKYSIWLNQFKLSKGNRIRIENKINRLALGDPTLIEIKPSTENFQHLFQERATTIEEYQAREKIYNELHNEVHTFLKKYDIDISRTSLIE